MTLPHLFAIGILLASSVSFAIEPTFRDLEYANASGVSLKLDLFVPVENSETKGPDNYPVIIWIHGGAWRSGSKSDVPIGSMLDNGFAIASVDYRLSPVAPFPAQIHDIKAAVRFLRGNHSRLKLDPDRFVMAGSSAGGHLAALAAVSDRVPELEGNLGGHINLSSRCHAIVSFFGASNLQTILSQSTPFGLNMRVPALELFLGSQPDKNPALAKLASPVAHVDASDPPLWLYHGDQDPQMPINQAHELEGAYKRVGLPVKFEVLYYGKHGGAEFFQKDRLDRLSQDLKRSLQSHRDPARNSRSVPRSSNEAQATNEAQSTKEVQTTSEGLRALTYNLSPAEIASLPDIQSFAKHPSDQFLIAWENLRTGHPYLGTASAKPHTGAHLYFQPPASGLDPKQPERYPPIFAIADGIVTRVDPAFRLRPVFFPGLGTTRANLRYGVDITFARAENEPVSFHYSIEPMISPESVDFYKPFLRVQPGQRVRRGDVIATMYLPPNKEDFENSHIHFNLIRQRQFQSPSIFSQQVDNQFAATWDPQRLREDWPVPACMGWKLAAEEDPFVNPK